MEILSTFLIWIKYISLLPTVTLENQCKPTETEIPENLAFPIRDVNLHVTHHSSANPIHQTKLQLRCFTRFYTAMPQIPHHLHGPHHIHSQNYTFPWGDLHPWTHRTHHPKWNSDPLSHFPQFTGLDRQTDRPYDKHANFYTEHYLYQYRFAS